MIGKKTEEFIRFVLAGTSTLVVDYGILLLLTEIFYVHYMLSAAISFTLAVIGNYYLCLIWVFKNRTRANKKQFIFFILSSIFGLLLNLVIMRLAVEHAHIAYIFAKVIATIIVTMWNFLTKKRSIEM